MFRPFFILMMIATAAAQDRGITDYWLIDKSVVQQSVYHFGAGKNNYEAFCRALSGLAGKLLSAKEEIQPDNAAGPTSALRYSFGPVTITSSRNSVRESKKVRDTSLTMTKTTYTISVVFTNGKQRCRIDYRQTGRLNDRDELLTQSNVRASSAADDSLEYSFTEMTFNDLLSILESEGVTFLFSYEIDAAYALACFPLSRVKQ